MHQIRLFIGVPVLPTHPSALKVSRTAEQVIRDCYRVQTKLDVIVQPFSMGYGRLHLQSFLHIDRLDRAPDHEMAHECRHQVHELLVDEFGPSMQLFLMLYTKMRPIAVNAFA